jgi:hypothetical protein
MTKLSNIFLIQYGDKRCTHNINFISWKFARTTKFYYADTFLTSFLLLASAIREQWFSFRNCIVNNLTNPSDLGGTIIVDYIGIIVLDITNTSDARSENCGTVWTNSLISKY